MVQPRLTQPGVERAIGAKASLESLPTPFQIMPKTVLDSFGLGCSHLWGQTAAPMGITSSWRPCLWGLRPWRKRYARRRGFPARSWWDEATTA